MAEPWASFEEGRPNRNKSNQTGLSVFGAMQMAQRKRRNGENNRLGLGLG